MGKRRSRKKRVEGAAKTKPHGADGSARQDQRQTSAKDSPVVVEEIATNDQQSISSRLLSPASITWFLALGLVCLFFLVLKMFAMHAYAGDEHIYIYQGKLVSNGVAPYSGFAMAHPPLQALFTAGLIKVFGYSFYLGRMLPVMWCLAGGIILAVMVKRESGSLASVFAAALYLIAYEPLRASSHYTGVSMTIALLLAGFLAYRTGHLKTCAALCVAAVFTRLYAIPGVIALVAWVFIADWRRGLKLAAWGAGIGAVAFVALGIWAGFEDTLHNMVKYHAQKTPMTPEKVSNMKNSVLFHNAVPAAIFVLSWPAIFFSMAAGWKKTGDTRGIWRRVKATVVIQKLGLPMLGTLTALTFMLVLLTMDRIWMYYFVPAFPFAAAAGGWFLASLCTGALRLARSRGSLSRARVSKGAIAGGLLLSVALVSVYFASPGLESNLAYWDKEMKKPAAKRAKTYNWRDGALPGFVNNAVKSTLWTEERTVGLPYSQFNYLLWHESRVLDVVDDVVEEIEARTDEGDEIFGDSGTVPLFALLSGRDIAANEVDTNSQRYRSGNADPEKTVKLIDVDSTKLIILRRRFGVAGVPEVWNLVKEKYSLVKTFRSAQNRVFLMYQRRGTSERNET